MKRPRHPPPELSLRFPIPAEAGDLFLRRLPLADAWVPEDASSLSVPLAFSGMTRGRETDPQDVKERAERVGLPRLVFHAKSASVRRSAGRSGRVLGFELTCDPAWSDVVRIWKNSMRTDLAPDADWNWAASPFLALAFADGSSEGSATAEFLHRHQVIEAPALSIRWVRINPGDSPDGGADAALGSLLERLLDPDF